MLFYFWYLNINTYLCSNLNKTDMLKENKKEIAAIISVVLGLCLLYVMVSIVGSNLHN